MSSKIISAFLFTTALTLFISASHEAVGSGPSSMARGKAAHGFSQKELGVPTRKIQRECVKTFTERAKNPKGEVVYPERFSVPTDKRSWSAEYLEYKPKYYRDPTVEANTTPNGQKWAEPESKINTKNLNEKDFTSYLATSQDKEIPRNPCGRTGIVGQGLLGKWGENWAADPIITRYAPKTGKLLVLLIKRGDSGQWAIPGGMVDPGETKLSLTAARELKEETGLDIKMDKAREVYDGQVDDPRNTDNSWMMTKAYHLHLDNETSKDVDQQLLKAEDAAEIKSIQWVPYDDPRINNLFASHTKFIQNVMKSIYPKIVSPFEGKTKASQSSTRMSEIAKQHADTIEKANKDHTQRIHQ
jgi:ADP-ribose pyrophosphatase